MNRIKINLARQALYVYGPELIRTYPVSTALNGAGQDRDSGQTPLGLHIVRAKIGAGEAIHSVFVARRATGEIYTPELGKLFPERDWILTRILWLSGKQPGFNRLGNVDTMQRYIYIHGTAAENQLGQPVSHGCVRMGNQDILDLFEITPVGCPVEIV